ncbi:hypothetical protein J3A83DRAFT_4239641 [Scleroderma citrinum]
MTTAEEQQTVCPSREATSESTTSSDKGKEKEESSLVQSSPAGEVQSSSSGSTSPTPDDNTSTPAPSGTLSAGAWQAIFSPQHSAYYFYNIETSETTWVNPLQQSSASTPSTASDVDSTANVNPNPYDPNSLEARALAAGIDPSLAHLDPSLALPANATPAGAYAAHFNARTGAFTATDARTPQHLSEYERMKRMSEFYFDMNAWEKEVEMRHTEEKEGGKKRKRPSKKDLDRFKEQKRLKKIAKTAWLRT